jgi:thiol-disulfide isomerase/thioredoxin
VSAPRAAGSLQPCGAAMLGNSAPGELVSVLCKEVAVMRIPVWLPLLFGLPGVREASLPFPVVTPTDLRARLERMGDTPVVVNFWATWCRPCIEELPLFERLAQRSQSSGLQVWLVNVDFPQEWWRRVVPFVRRRGLRASVLLLRPSPGERWLDTLHREWSGAIPATLFWRASLGVAELYEGELDSARLWEYVERLSAKP